MKSHAFQHSLLVPKWLAPLNPDFCPVKRLLNQDPSIWQFRFLKSRAHFLQGVGVETRQSTFHTDIGCDRITLVIESGGGYFQSRLFLYKEIYRGWTRCSETKTWFNHAPIESCSGDNFYEMSANRTVWLVL